MDHLAYLCATPGGASDPAPTPVVTPAATLSPLNEDWAADDSCDDDAGDDESCDDSPNIVLASRTADDLENVWAMNNPGAAMGDIRDNEGISASNKENSAMGHFNQFLLKWQPTNLRTFGREHVCAEDITFDSERDREAEWWDLCLGSFLEYLRFTTAEPDCPFYPWGTTK
jgi:hypothetical protein